jgi:response regulator of citrate/malate metabolism
VLRPEIQKIKILTVENSLLIVLRLRNILEEIPGVQFLGNATSIADADRLIRITIPDVIFLDINLGSQNENGITLLHSIRGKKIAVKVIMLTNHSGKHYRDLCRSADFFLDKSDDFELIPEILTRMVREANERSGDSSIKNTTRISTINNNTTQMKTVNTIALIDDDPISHVITSKIIKHYSSYETEGFMEAKKALAEWQTRSVENLPNYLLLDIDMPEMNGWQFLEEFEKLPSEKREHTCIVMFSSSSHSTDIDRSRRYNSVRGFISKPLTKEKLETLEISCHAVK